MEPHSGPLEKGVPVTEVEAAGAHHGLLSHSPGPWPDAAPTGTRLVQGARPSLPKRSDSSATASPTFRSAPELGQGCGEWVPWLPQAACLGALQRKVGLQPDRGPGQEPATRALPRSGLCQAPRPPCPPACRPPRGPQSLRVSVSTSQPEASVLGLGVQGEGT